jgi:hypothetical protein
MEHPFLGRFQAAGSDWEAGRKYSANIPHKPGVSHNLILTQTHRFREAL